ncbi:hypothetical protein [Fulvivirga sedimenti]|uniref:Uncharacterized protein n=1 Tax=Fulvivirga sedimenti TaxID=2879465 RepID=A0A9X1KZ42_9BACT|nr:hypothetical protein [Fulvivirga sedimenti]MCA6078528.1 hypothetical protein [Fulvivirga sedimenti]
MFRSELHRRFRSYGSVKPFSWLNLSAWWSGAMRFQDVSCGKNIQINSILNQPTGRILVDMSCQLLVI